jgi:hypothetical protein
MSGFLKTLFGDVETVVVVAIVMATEVLLIAGGQVALAAFTVPPLVLVGAAWLAVH